MASNVLSGGNKITAYLEELSKKVNDAASLKVGFIGGATYPDGTPVAMVAAINEFGAPSRNQPPRPFFRAMIAKNNRNWGNKLAGYLDANDYNSSIALNKLGEDMIGELQDSISEFTDPELKQSTIDAKGFDKPLINTGHMFNGVTKNVE